MKKLLVLFCILSITVMLSSFNSPFAGDMAVIVNKENTLTTLSPGEAKLYYLRKLKSRWPGINKGIRPADRKSKCVEREAFYGTILKMSEAEVSAYFAERQFQNAERLPDKFSSDAEIIDFVEQEAGSIGYVNTKSLTAEARARVNVVLEF
jgi:ABC-type phosphate transport system substrate-binding protein